MNTARTTSQLLKPEQVYCELVNLIDLLWKECDNSSSEEGWFTGIYLQCYLGTEKPRLTLFAWKDNGCLEKDDALFENQAGML